MVNPFNDSRRNRIATVWVFDLDNDILRFYKEDQNLCIPLHRIRQRYSTVSDFEPCDPPTPHTQPLQSIIREPCVRMRRHGIQTTRHDAFVSKVLTDFGIQWRHILCSNYNNSTFRKLACAIIRLVTLDFNVVEATTRRRGRGGYLVEMHSLPEWDALRSNIVRAGGVSIVIAQHPQHAVTVIREDYENYILSNGLYDPFSTSKHIRTYLVLTVREIMLYRVGGGSERCTQPERLFDGVLPPSDAAIELLLEATRIQAPETPLHGLAVELQDIILDNVSKGPIERAKVGCLLDIGSPFTWRSGNRNIEREEGHGDRTELTPMESYIWFGNSSSGLAYK